MFSDYVKLGNEHILDPNGYDHILFVATLCVFYSLDQWKKILILVTAFTLGHTLTLALSALNIVQISPALVEILIPITIIITAVSNIYAVKNKTETSRHVIINYIIPLGFGLIHGLGFSNYFKAIIGESESVIMPLFAFNIGVETGQIVIVFMVMMAGYFLVNILKLKKHIWTISVSSIAIIISVFLLLGKLN
ncbi:MAG: HupE/UreJ family protein [Saprospiraceae bacterium]|nr:HupE/UreJ family protein [Saprospiraceae bacterium]